MTTLVLTIIGDDRSGLVDALSGVIVEHGGNWTKSHLAELAGKFAGIVVVTVPDANTVELVEALGPLESDGLLDIAIGIAGDGSDSDGRTAVERRYRIELVGQDRPGIVHEISDVLAGQGVNITELVTATTSAPMAGGLLFTATAHLDVPPNVNVDELRVALEAIADELMVDVDLDPAL